METASYKIKARKRTIAAAEHEHGRLKKDGDTCVNSAKSTVMRVRGAFGREAAVKQHNFSPRLSLASEQKPAGKQRMDYS